MVRLNWVRVRLVGRLGLSLHQGRNRSRSWGGALLWVEVLIQKILILSQGQRAENLF